MKKQIALALLSVCLSAESIAQDTKTRITFPGEEEIQFEPRSGEPVGAFQGTLLVPENRADPDSRKIPLTYVRFPATTENAGSPIVYLAGGPGGSGIRTARVRRFAMFMALRQYGDVIALDQRGTGASNDIPACRSSKVVPHTEPVSDDAYLRYNREALMECFSFWRENGVDIAGYNTRENALDLDALRQHFDAKKITLWGISYGSHLSLAALKYIEDSIDRIVIASAEGLNQTIKMPARTDRYFDRLQKAVDTQPAAKAAYPDIKAMIRRVHDKLEANPVMLQLQLRDGQQAEYLFARRDMQNIASALVSDPQRAGMLLSLYLAVDNDVYEPLAQLVARFIVPGDPIEFRGMPVATDIASGMTATRKLEIREQAKTALLKDYLNFTYHFDGLVPELDLGDEFRAKPTSDVPLLLLSGTLDGRTYIESQREAVSGLGNATLITVENAGHNLFMTSPDVQDAINRFMEGKPSVSDTITIELPDLAPQR